MKRIMTYSAVVLATLLVMVGLWQFRLVLLLFVLSLFMAATIRPFVNWLTARGLSKSWAQLLLYAIGIGSIILIFLLIGDLILIELNSVANLLIIEYEGLYRHWQTGPAWQQMVVSLLPEAFAAQDADLQQMLPVVVNVTRSVSGVVGGLLLLLALSTYWSADQHRFERLWLSLLPAQGRAYARDSWRQIETAVGSYLLSQTAQSILAGSALSLGAALIGLSYPFLLGFIGALAAFVPLFGGLVTAIVAFGLGSLESYGLGVAAAVYALFIFLVLDFAIKSRLWPRERRGFLLTILVSVPLVEAFGLWGLIIAPPLAAALEVLVWQTYQASIDRPNTTLALDDLETRFQKMMQKSAEAEYGDVTPELRNLTIRLSNLLADVRNTKRENDGR